MATNYTYEEIAQIDLTLEAKDNAETINYDPKACEEAIALIEAITTQVQNMGTAVSDFKTKVGASWEGEAATAFATSYENIAKSMQEASEAISKATGTIEQVKSDMEDGENFITGMATGGNA